MRNFSEEKIGLIYGLSAFTLWGFLVVFFKQFNGIDPYAPRALVGSYVAADLSGV